MTDENAEKMPSGIPERAGRAPEVSVVVIFLDTESFLQEAIESVFAQTYGNWELLLVDDGSTDQSSGIARRAVDRDPFRVRYLEHPGHENRGRSAARNLGIENARGEFIAFLDADDVWFPRKLERQLARIRPRPEVGMVYGATQLWHSWTGKELDCGRDLTPDPAVPLEMPLEGAMLLARMLRRQALAPCTCSMLLRRQIAQGVGGFEPAFRGMYDDQAFLAKVCLATSVFASGECWDRYRQHPDSCYSVARTRGEHLAARRIFLDWLDGYVRMHRIGDGRVREALERERNALPDSGAPEMTGRIRKLARSVLPSSVHRWLRSRWPGGHSAPASGHVDFGSLRRLTPISRRWGKDRGGEPIDRYYIERFLAAHAGDIRGRVLEVGDDTYTRQFGGETVTQSDVLHAIPGNPRATFVADLTRGPGQLPVQAFDCVVLTQVLQMVGDPAAAMRNLYPSLKPGGVVLASVPGISQVSRWDMERWGDSWRFTTLSARRLFEAVFPPEQVSVAPHGNVLTAIAFLHGLASDELRPKDLEYLDADYQLVITVRAEKPAAASERVPNDADGHGASAGK